ncbi:MAG: hypothetical protein L0387_39460 [Acidobacteria bacterium]|nr:hypothetical protein [Acidobacteriota bacterium]
MQRVTLLFLLLSLTANAQALFPDDPLEFEPKPLPVKDVAKRKLSDYYDLLTNTLDTPGQLNRKTRKPIRALAVNTLGEPMQGAWWVKRHYYKPMTVEELVAGPGKDHPPNPRGPWTVVGAKNEGITPGFVILDAKEDLYFIKFDPLTNPEMATGADQVAIRLVYALGYHVPENYLVEFSEEMLVLGKDVTLADRLGRRRRMTGRNLNEILLKVPKNGNGRYRATASRAIPGKGIGPYRYHGTRRDDPNDFVLHEHRRDLRGFAIVSAWIGHDDSRAINTYDALVEENGDTFIRHYILDLGSTFGSGTQRANSPRSGGEYLFGWKQSAVQLFSLGLAVPYWAKAHFPDLPSIGRFESATFDPELWVPEYPNPAFLNRLPDDEFWAAKQIMSLGNEQIRAIVESGQYSNPKAAEWLAQCLIERRDKIGRAFYKKVLPIDKFEIRDNQLVFEDLSEKADFGAAGPYTIQWFQFDSATGATTPMSAATGSLLPAQSGPYIVARIESRSRPNQRVDVTVRSGIRSLATIAAVDRRW